MTEVRRIDLSEVEDLDAALTAECDNLLVAEYRLASTFVFGTELILIFQRP